MGPGLDELATETVSARVHRLGACQKDCLRADFQTPGVLINQQISHSLVLERHTPKRCRLGAAGLRPPPIKRQARGHVEALSASARRIPPRSSLRIRWRTDRWVSPPVRRLRLHSDRVARHSQQRLIEAHPIPPLRRRYLHLSGVNHRHTRSLGELGR